MPTKIRDVYLKVTIAWNGKLLVASSCEASAHAMRSTASGCKKWTLPTETDKKVEYVL